MKGTYKVALAPGDDPMLNPLVAKLMKLPGAVLTVQENVSGEVMEPLPGYRKGKYVDEVTRHSHTWPRMAVIHAQGELPPRRAQARRSALPPPMRLDAALRRAHANPDDREYWDSMIELAVEREGKTVTLAVTRVGDREHWRGWIVHAPGAVLGANYHPVGWVVSRISDGRQVPKLTFPTLAGALAAAQALDSPDWTETEFPQHRDELAQRVKAMTPKAVENG